MRDNGVEGFPDPEPSDGGGITQVGPEGDVDAGVLEDAEAACEDFLPGAGDGGNEVDPEGEQLMFEYSQCMRDNGIEDYPDPGPDGGITIDSDTLGVDPTGPEMRAAEEACQEIIGGEGSNEERTEDS